MNAHKTGRRAFLASTLVTIAAFASGCGGGSAGLNLPNNTFTFTNIDSNANLVTFPTTINTGSLTRINGVRYFSANHRDSFAANSRDLNFSISGDPEIAVGDIIPALAKAGEAQATLSYSESLGTPPRIWSGEQQDPRQKGFVKIIAITNNIVTFEARNFLMVAVTGQVPEPGQGGEGSFLLNGKGSVELTSVID